MVAEKSERETSAAEKLISIAAEVASCHKCPLAQARTNTVPGEGSPTAEIMFVGEGPGRDEDESGRPFVGRAGKLLDELIASLPMRREDVYIANIVKCRPPNNRDPERAEVDQCSNYLTQQIEIIDPLVIVPLGRHALGWFMPELRITQSNGKIFRNGNRVLMPLLHPSSGLRNPEHMRMLRDGIHNLGDAILEGIRVRNQVVERSQHPIEGSHEPPQDRPSADLVAESVEAINGSQSTVVEQAEAVALTETVPTEKSESVVNIFERSQTQDEIQAELKRQRAIEAAQEAADTQEDKLVIDDRQASFF